MVGGVSGLFHHCAHSFDLLGGSKRFVDQQLLVQPREFDLRLAPIVECAQRDVAALVSPRVIAEVKQDDPKLLVVVGVYAGHS